MARATMAVSAGVEGPDRRQRRQADDEAREGGIDDHTRRHRPALRQDRRNGPRAQHRRRREDSLRDRAQRAVAGARRPAADALATDRARADDACAGTRTGRIALDRRRHTAAARRARQRSTATCRSSIGELKLRSGQALSRVTAQFASRDAVVDAKFAADAVLGGSVRGNIQIDGRRSDASRRAAAGGCAGAGSAQARGRGGGHAGNPRRQGAREHRHQRPRHHAAPRRELDERNDSRGVGPGDSRAGDDARRVGGLAGRGRARPVPHGRCRYRAPLRGRSPAARQWRCARRPVDCDRDRQDRCVGERHARFSRRDARLVGAAADPCGSQVRRVAVRGPRAHPRALRQAGGRHRRCAIGAIDRQARRAWRARVEGWRSARAAR